MGAVLSCVLCPSLAIFRRDIEIIAREQEVLATASSSVLAIKVRVACYMLGATRTVVVGVYQASYIEHHTSYLTHHS